MSARLLGALTWAGGPRRGGEGRTGSRQCCLPPSELGCLEALLSRSAWVTEGLENGRRSRDRLRSLQLPVRGGSAHFRACRRSVEPPFPPRCFGDCVIM